MRPLDPLLHVPREHGHELFGLGLGLGALALRLLPFLNREDHLGTLLSLTGLLTLAGPPLVFLLKLDFTQLFHSWVMVAKFVVTIGILNAAFFFLGMLKANVGEWLMMNTCTPSIAIFVGGFLLSSPLMMVAGSVLMFYYGTGGLFIFGWDAYNIIPQIGHILMTLAVIYTIVHMVRGRRWRVLGLGVLLGLAILIPLTIVQTYWLNAHPEMMEMLFSGNWEMPNQ